ncbi:hypothetical protein QKW35_02565 [Pontibacterium granulatum]|uniref:hypothetical protein n=1 Tax=Pontibacterium granulatum TaxID=2036029 RepID=UPI00249BC81B|nr:hypothetical protein [Pontibacterium granulatum]MDI3323247.1 hypothetical protein [Pontibacterium granulatum]
MSRDDDFDLPDLGPAEPERVSTNNRHVDVVNPPAQTVKRSGGWFTSLMLILLVASCSGLGYWGLTMFEQLQAERKVVAELQQQMREMRELLNLAESSAQKSGDTLLDQLTNMGKTAQDKYKHFDSEIAKLWTVAYQTNKPELEKQAKQLAEQKKQLAEQGKQLKAQSDKQAGYIQQIATQKKALDEAKTALAAQDKKLSTITGKLDQSESTVKSLVDAELKKNRSDLAATQTAIRLSEEAMTEEVTALTTSMRKLTDRISALESAQRQNGLERRVKNNEDAVKSYDATRRELNRSLLQIRKKINELQLKLESRA